MVGIDLPVAGPFEGSQSHTGLDAQDLKGQRMKESPEIRHAAGRRVRAWSAFMTAIAMILALVGPSPVSANVIATTGQLIKINPPADKVPFLINR